MCFWDTPILPCVSILRRNSWRIVWIFNGSIQTFCRNVSIGYGWNGFRWRHVNRSASCFVVSRPRSGEKSAVLLTWGWHQGMIKNFTQSLQVRALSDFQLGHPGAGFTSEIWSAKFRTSIQHSWSHERKRFVSVTLCGKLMMMHLTSQRRLLISGIVQDVRPTRTANLRATTVTSVWNANSLYASKQRGCEQSLTNAVRTRAQVWKFRWTEYSDEISRSLEVEDTAVDWVFWRSSKTSLVSDIVPGLNEFPRGIVVN